MIPAALECSRQARRRLAPSSRRAARTPGADRYRKHFPATAHLWILLLHGLSASPSLRQTHATLHARPGLFGRIGLGQGLSYSQLARSATSRPSACVETLLAALVAEAHRSVLPDRSWRILRRVQIIDSTVLRLSVTLSPWSQHKGFTPGVRVQTRFDLARAIPTRLRLHLVDTNDHHALWTEELNALRGWTVLLDLGYYGHRQFARLREHGVSFLSRLHPQAGYQVTASRRVSPTRTADGDLVLSDETITLGSPNNRAGTVLIGIRLIRSRNRCGREQAFLTDRFDLTAPELVRLYRYRWRIELFFRFLKRPLGMTTPLGQSRAAVWLTVLLAAMVAVLLALTDMERPRAMSRIAWLRAIGVTLQTVLRGG